MIHYQPCRGRAGFLTAMKVIDYIPFDMPDWALSYVVNGDASGLTDEEEAMVDDWLRACIDNLQADRPECCAQPEVDLDAEPSFNPFPAFGLACTTVAAAVVAWVPNEHPAPAMSLPWDVDAMA